MLSWVKINNCNAMVFVRVWKCFEKLTSRPKSLVILNRNDVRIASRPGVFLCRVCYSLHSCVDFQLQTKNIHFRWSGNSKLSIDVGESMNVFLFLCVLVMDLSKGVHYPLKMGTTAAQKGRKTKWMDFSSRSCKRQINPHVTLVNACTKHRTDLWVCVCGKLTST